MKYQHTWGKWFGITILMILSYATIVLAADHFVILQYHHISDKTPTSTSVSPEMFEQHLNYLENSGYKVWPLVKSIYHIQNGLPVPENCIVITMDDAYRSVYTEAFPRLKKRGWPFTVFIATGGVDKGSSTYMTWPQMRLMLPYGASFASHTQTHPYLIRKRTGESEHQRKTRIISEIEQSRHRIKKELGMLSNLFAYPYGEYNLELKKITTDLGLIGISQHSGAVWSGSDFGALPRFPMSGSYASMDSFKLKIRSLPLPVIESQPENPVITKANNPPRLRLKLGPGNINLPSVSCFASGQGKITVNWLDRKNRIFECVATHPLPMGRSRYNCTARHLKSNRYFWYSRQWIR